MDGNDFDGTLNGTLWLKMWGDLLGAPTETNLMLRSVADPIVFPSGDWRFFRLEIK